MKKHKESSPIEDSEEVILLEYPFENNAINLGLEVMEDIMKKVDYEIFLKDLDEKIKPMALNNLFEGQAMVYNEAFLKCDQKVDDWILSVECREIEAPSITEYVIKPQMTA